MRSGADGGGIDNAGTMTLDRSVIIGNSAAAHGGGLFNDGTATLDLCLGAGNTSASGGGIYSAPAGEVTLMDALVVGNKKDNIVGPVTGS